MDKIHTTIFPLDPARETDLREEKAPKRNFC